MVTSAAPAGVRLSETRRASVSKKLPSFRLTTSAYFLSVPSDVYAETSGASISIGDGDPRLGVFVTFGATGPRAAVSAAVLPILRRRLYGPGEATTCATIFVGS